MEKRKKREHDFSVNVFRVVQEATGQLEKPKPEARIFDAKALEHLGGLKSGKARAILTSARRVEIAKKVALARREKQPHLDDRRYCFFS